MPGRTAPGGWCGADAGVVGTSRPPSPLLLERLFGAGNQSRIVARGDHPGENLDRAVIPRLQAELVNGDAADAGAPITLDALDQEFHDIEGERSDLAPLAADGVDGMPADERRRVAQGREQWPTATLITEMIHELHTGRPHPGAGMACPGDESHDCSLALVEQLLDRSFANRPVVRVKVTEGFARSICRMTIHTAQAEVPVPCPPPWRFAGGHPTATRPWQASWPCSLPQARNSTNLRVEHFGTSCLRILSRVCFKALS